MSEDNGESGRDGPSPSTVSVHMTLQPFEMSWGLRLKPSDSDKYLRVSSVHPGTAAARAGLKEDAIILSVNGVGGARAMTRELNSGQRDIQLEVVFASGGGGGGDGGSGDGGGGDGGGGGNGGGADDGDADYDDNNADDADPDYDDADADADDDDADKRNSDRRDSDSETTDGGGSGGGGGGSSGGAGVTSGEGGGKGSGTGGEGSGHGCGSSGHGGQVANVAAGGAAALKRRGRGWRGNWYLVTRQDSNAPPCELRGIPDVVEHVGSRPIGGAGEP
jgi:hypothetical protein